MALFGRPGRPVLDVLTPEHAEACAALHAGAFAHGWSGIEFERLLAADASRTDAAFEAGRPAAPIGFILSRIAADEAEVLTIVVSPRWRGKGLGRQLLDRHVERLAGERVHALFLDVNADNAPARALYARAGFVEVGRRKGYYAGGGGAPRADALVLRRTVS